MKRVLFAIVFCTSGAMHFAQMKPLRGEHLFISEAEVTNLEYQEFLMDNKNNEELLKKILPDTLVWRTKLSYCEPYREYYHKHPAYRDYPVVGVSYDQAIAFCKWKTKVYNQNLKSTQCKDCLYDSVIFRLPTEKEWECAAKGGHPNAVLPWNHNGLRNQSKKYQGNMLANFVAGRGIFIGGKGHLTDNADVTAPVYAYWPNDYGLYNMAGNVAEMIQEKGFSKGGSWQSRAHQLKISARDTFNTPNSFTGFRVVMEVHQLKDKAKKPQEIVLNKKFYKNYLAAIKEDSLYFGKYEVSNQLYNKFVKETGNKNKPQNELWNDAFEYGYYWSGNYHTHSQFKEYPVVNISKAQAEAFCDWLTQKYNQQENRAFKKVKFKLPTKSEWETAAKGGLTLSPYPWGGPYLRNVKGSYLANFSPKWSPNENINHTDTLTKEVFFNTTFNEMEDEDGEPVLAPINSYFPNDFGGFCFAGNAAEMISDADISKGGSWGSKADVLQVDPKQFGIKEDESILENYDGNPSPFVGFRVFMEVIEK